MIFRRVLPRDAHGHTLIELLTVLVVIMVIVSLAAPSMTSYVERNQVQRALDRVVTDLALARMMAVRSGSRVVFQLQSPTSYSLAPQSGSGPSKTVSLSADFPGVAVAVSAADAQFVFDSRGLLVNTAQGRIIAARGTSADSAMLTASGRVYRGY